MFGETIAEVYSSGHPQPPLQVYGEAIKHVTDFKYLGSQMASSASDFKRRKALAWGAFWKLERLWRSSELPILTKIKLFHTTCVTILLYGCESWVLSQDMECKINAFATSSYRVMLNIKRRDHVSTSIIYSMTDTQPLVHCVRKRQLSFLGHVLRLPEEEPVKKICSLYTTTWQKETWTSTYLLPILHQTFVGVWWRWYVGWPDRHTCPRSMCMEKSCNRLLRSRRMMMIAEVSGL